MKIKLALPSLEVSVIIFFCIFGVYNRIFLLLGVGSFLSVLLYEYIKWLLTRKGEVVIQTPDGSNQPYHPSVLFFPDGWNGHRYWMAYTPFPIGAKPYQDRWEYPCIAVSEDGINWSDGNSNLPLDDLTEAQIQAGDYFSDTHLVYNVKENQIECYYRLSEEIFKGEAQKGVWLFRRCTRDGKNWTEREISIAPEEKGIHGDYSPVISPAVIIDDNKYKMWYVIERNQKMSIHMAESEDGLTWNNEKDCILDGFKINPWHLDCKNDDGIYWLITYDFSQRIILWKSYDGQQFDFVRVILTPSKQIGSFFRSTLYRACLVKIHDCWNVYFSAGDERKVAIGMMKGDRLENVEVESASNSFSIQNFLIDLYEKYFFLYRWGLWKVKQKLHIQKEGKEWF